MSMEEISRILRHAKYIFFAEFHGGETLKTDANGALGGNPCFHLNV